MTSLMKTAGRINTQVLDSPTNAMIAWPLPVTLWTYIRQSSCGGRDLFIRIPFAFCDYTPGRT